MPSGSTTEPLYNPPAGYYDQPFTWVYDGSGLVDGQDALNQFIYLLHVTGDFILRRVVGMGTVLAVGTGRFQIRDGEGNYIEADPEFVSLGSDDMAVIPEIRYRETGIIRFDLYNVTRFTQG